MNTQESVTKKDPTVYTGSSSIHTLIQLGTPKEMRVALHWWTRFLVEEGVGYTPEMRELIGVLIGVKRGAFRPRELAVNLADSLIIKDIRLGGTLVPILGEEYPLAMNEGGTVSGAYTLDCPSLSRRNS